MSGEAKHTPGPWAVNPTCAVVDAFETGVPVPVCKLLWPTDLRSEGETEANGAIIAVAPELLDSLVESEAMLTLVVDFILKLAPGWTSLESASAHPTIKRARAAIAAAKAAG